MEEVTPGAGDGTATWSSRIKAAVRAGEAIALTRLIKSALPVAAATGRLDLVSRWITHVSEEAREHDPQLLYWSGVSILFSNPADAAHHFRRAFELFEREPLSDWTLLAWAGLVDATFFLYRDLRELDPLFEWMTPAHEAAVDRMPRPTRSLVVASALFGLVFRAPKHPRLGTWKERAERLVEVNPTSDIGARLTAGLLLDYTWRGDMASAKVAWSRFEARASRSLLSPMSTGMRHTNAATLALHEGHARECIEAVDAGLKHSAATSVRTWDGVLHCHGAAMHLGQGNLAPARKHLDAIESLFADGIPADEAYYRAVLQWYGYASGDSIGVVSRVQSTIALADQKGVPYFMAVARVSSGLILFEAGHHADGRAHLDDGMSIGSGIDNPVIAWIGGLFGAHLDYAEGNSTASDTKLRNALALGRDHALSNFFCWPRAIIADLIDRALEQGHYLDYLTHLIDVHALARGNVATRSDRWAYPVRLYTLGAPRITLRDGGDDSLSAQYPRQLELLAAIIARYNKPVPLATLAAEIYAGEHVEPIASLKRVLHSLRGRMKGESISQRDAALSFDFAFVWVDACSLLELRRVGSTSREVERWLDLHYHGHFLEMVTGSPVIENLRRRLREFAERSIKDTVADANASRNDAEVARLKVRWEGLFEAVFV